MIRLLFVVLVALSTLAAEAAYTETSVPPTKHFMNLFGLDRAYASHFALFTYGHDYESIIQVDMFDSNGNDILQAYRDDRRNYTASPQRADVYMIDPSEMFTYKTLVDSDHALPQRSSFRGDIVRGSVFGGDKTKQDIAFANVTFVVACVKHFRSLRSVSPPIRDLTFTVFGTQYDVYVKRWIQGYPSLDEVYKIELRTHTLPVVDVWNRNSDCFMNIYQSPPKGGMVPFSTKSMPELNLRTGRAVIVCPQVCTRPTSPDTAPSCDYVPSGVFPLRFWSATMTNVTFELKAEHVSAPVVAYPTSEDYQYIPVPAHDSAAGPCAKGYTGDYCADCDVGYRPSGDDCVPGETSPKEPVSTASIVFISGFSILVVIVIAMGWWVHQLRTRVHHLQRGQTYHDSYSEFIDGE